MYYQNNYNKYIFYFVCTIDMNVIIYTRSINRKYYSVNLGWAAIKWHSYLLFPLFQINKYHCVS